MSWIAVAGGERNWTCPDIFSSDAASGEALLPRGSLVIETRLSPHGRPQMLLAYERRHPWAGRISLQALPGGSVVLVMAQGDAVFHTVLPAHENGRTDVLRLTFSWDSPSRWARLSVEQPEGDEVRSVETPAPPPLMLSDIFTMIHRPQLCERDDDVIYFAVSSAIEPVGPMPSIFGETEVSTPFGARVISKLKPGDLVYTHSGELQPVLANISRRVPALGSFRPVRLRSPYLGLTRYIHVAPHQKLVIGGSEVEYTFGREAVLFPAENLVNGFTGIYEDPPLFVRYHQVLLPNHDAIQVSGCAIESLYVGRMRRDRDLMDKTLLADFPARSMPEQFRKGYQVLKPFEAVTLAEARAA